MFELVDAEKAHFPIKVLCEVFSLSRSDFYAWKGRAPSVRERCDEQLAVEIAAAHAKSQKRYGSPRVQLSSDTRNEGSTERSDRDARGADKRSPSENLSKSS